MPDWILNLGMTGAENLTSGLKKVTSDLNEAAKAAEKQRKHAETINLLEKRLSNLAREERKQAFDRLSVEEKILKLQQQRERIQERLTRAQGNEYRTAALQVHLRQTDRQLQLAQGEVPGFLGRVKGALQAGWGGAFLGGLAGGGIAASIQQAIGTAFSKFREALNEGKEIKDVAEAARITPRDVLRLRRASLSAGPTQDVGLNSLRYLDAARSAAIGGDPKAMGLLKHYGVSEEAYRNEETSNMEIALTIRRGLGERGATQAQAANMRELFGRRWSEFQALTTAMAKMADDATAKTEKEIEDLNVAELKIRRANSAFSGLWRKASAWAVAHPYLSGVLGAYSEVFGGESPEASPNKAPGLPELPTTLGPAPKIVKSNDSVVTNTPPRQGAPMPTADALARVGLFVGGAPGGEGRLLSLLQQQNRHLESIDQGIHMLIHYE